MKILLKIKNLSVAFSSPNEEVEAVRNVSLEVRQGEILGLVGESGAGKSTIGNAVVDLLDSGRVTKGSIVFADTDLTKISPKQMQGIRGARIGMIFQDPQTSLNPLMTIGAQLIEAITSASGVRGDEQKAEELLKAVGISEAAVRLKAYPHEFSGGMRQRVVIAMALAGDPDLIIADEPTTALDVSTQAQILDLIKNLCRERNLGVLLITHDIGVIAEAAERLAVMHDGEIVETGEVKSVLKQPRHEYTKALISAVPRSDRKLKRLKVTGRPQVRSSWLAQGQNKFNHDIAVKVGALNKEFTSKRGFLRVNRMHLKAVRDVSFTIKTGETFGLVGESGSGKSTVVRLIAGLTQPSSGHIEIFGNNVRINPKSKETRAVRLNLQMVFQDPYSSLNASRRVGDIIEEPLRFHGLTSTEDETEEVILGLIEQVGLPKSALTKYPYEFSGGQRQRISIARALASRPRILICDEPTSSLDVSVQARILNLLKDLQEELGLTMLFISHDLAVIRQMCDRVAVMREGSICEISATENLFNKPKHDYTRHLLALMPKMDYLLAS